MCEENSDEEEKMKKTVQQSNFTICVAWYSNEVKQQIELGCDSTDVNVDLRLTVLKPLHAVWLVDLYNHLTCPVCVRLIAKGWEKAGISDLLDGQTELPPEDPFTDIELALEIE